MAKGSGSTKSSSSRSPKGLSISHERKMNEARKRAGEALKRGNEKAYYVASAESQYHLAMHELKGLASRFPTNGLDAHKDQTSPIIKARADAWKKKIKRLKKASSGFETIYNG